MGVEDPDDGEATILGVSIRSEVLSGRNRVDLRRRRLIGRGVEEIDHAGVGRSPEKAARLVGQAGEAVSDHLVGEVARQPQHGARIPKWLARNDRYALVMAQAKRTKAKRDAKRSEPPGDKVVASNRRARHDYDILETMECGIVLQGSEVKSLREGKAQLADAYARVDDHELWLFSLHIPPWKFSAGFGGHDPDRKRKLLAHRSQIAGLIVKTQQQPLTLIPLSLYFHEGKAKVELGVARGRKLHDKRRALMERENQRDIERAVRDHARWS